VDNVEWFINLTTGLEFLEDPTYQFLSVAAFLRLQSSHCETKQWDKIISDLDNNFLMKLAIGRKCIVLDCTSRKNKNNTSRACWQGLSWIKYCLYRTWFYKEIELEQGMTPYFRTQYNALPRFIRRKLKYYRKFLRTNELDLHYVCRPTDNDGNDEFYRMIVDKYLT
jgi:hypothetical protein